MKIIYKDGTVAEAEASEELEVLRHSAAHIMAQAVKRLYPHADFGYGPATEKGFYYDIDLGDTKLSDDDLAAIEAEMKKITKENLPIRPYVLSREEAIAHMQELGEKYKVEHIGDLPEDAEISFFKQGDYVDMCTGPHLCYTKALKAFKITGQSGAYWKNDKNNKMLTRIYGTAFKTQEELDAYLKMVEEAERRDHNKLGRELGFFTTVDSIGQGLPILLPKGSRVIQLLQRWVEDVEQEHGYLLTKTPLMAKRDLYRISGHWDHYLDGMFVLGDPFDEEKECLAMRPMTCPFQYQVYLNQARSYRDLPMRLGETSTLFRNEDSGEMHGLIRVRQFTISEGHLVLRPDQLEQEFADCLSLSKYFLETVGLLEDCTFRFSQWDPNNTDKYEGLLFAPNTYSPDYLFASVMVANPLFWMEMSNLDDDYADSLAKISNIYKKYKAELFASHVIPVGNRPDGMNFSGYCCADEGKNTVHLILFREAAKGDTFTFDLPKDISGLVGETIYQNNDANYSIDNNKITVNFSAERSFIWLRFA